MRVKLKDVCEKATSNLKQSDILSLDGKYPVYGASGYLGNIDSYHQDKPYIAVVKDGAGIGKTTILPPKSSVIGTMQYLIPKENVMPEYLYYVVKHMRLQKYYTGATIPHIYFKDYQNEEFNLADSIRQREIVKVLKNVEDTIRYQKIEINKFDELIKARFIEMFGDLKNNEKDWDLKTFEEMSVLITDGEHSTPKRTKEGIYLLSARNVLNHSLQLKDVDYINRDEYLRIAKRVVPKKGDILISCSGTIGRCCSVPDSLQLQMVRSVALIRFKEVINPIFAEYMITSDYLQEQINSSKTMSSQANLFQGKIRKLKGFLPPTELQQQFADFVRQVDKSREEVKKSLEKTQQLYDSLMQEYFG
jgi:type I restriction enzyme S subunit